MRELPGKPSDSEIRAKADSIRDKFLARHPYAGAYRRRIIAKWSELNLDLNQYDTESKQIGMLEMLLLEVMYGGSKA